MKSHGLRKNSMAGFTVLELLIALCILSLFSIYAASAYQQIRRMNETTRQLETTDSTVAVQSYVRNLVSGARAIMVKAGQSIPVVAFRGGESRLALITASDGTLETGGLYSATLETRPRGDGLADFVTSRRLLRAASASSNDDELLLGEIASLHFRYFGEASGETSPSWQTQWVDKETLPELVEVTILMPSGKRQVWPELIVRPMSGP
jgi:general secretion pathway protein J